MKHIFIFLFVILSLTLNGKSQSYTAVMTSGSQNIAGVKTFDNITISNTGSLLTGSLSNIQLSPTSLTYNGIGAKVSIESSGNKHALILKTSGTQGAVIVSESRSGAPAGWFVQDLTFDSPVLKVIRSGSYGVPSDNPLILIQGSYETTGTSPVLVAGGCLALTGDNYIIMWGDGSMSVPGGLTDGKIGMNIGKKSIDLVYRQLVATDGITPQLTWSGSTVNISTPTIISGTDDNSGAKLQVGGNVYAAGSIRISGSAPASNASGVAGEMIFTNTHIYRCFGNGDWRRISVSYTTY